MSLLEHNFMVNRADKMNSENRFFFFIELLLMESPIYHFWCLNILIVKHNIQLLLFLFGLNIQVWRRLGFILAVKSVCEISDMWWLSWCLTHLMHLFFLRLWHAWLTFFVSYPENAFKRKNNLLQHHAYNFWIRMLTTLQIFSNRCL